MPNEYRGIGVRLAKPGARDLMLAHLVSSLSTD
jgi:hypothetical protein